MNSYIVFRAVVPPGFNLEAYEERSNEPLRYDVVTLVQAENAQSAINAVIASTGIVAIGLAAVEVETFGFQSKNRFGKGGALIAEEDTSKLLETSTEADARNRIAELEAEIAEINKIGNSGRTRRASK